MKQLLFFILLFCQIVFCQQNRENKFLELLHNTFQLKLPYDSNKDLLIFDNNLMKSEYDYFIKDKIDSSAYDRKKSFEYYNGYYVKVQNNCYLLLWEKSIKGNKINKDYLEDILSVYDSLGILKDHKVIAKFSKFEDSRIKISKDNVVTVETYVIQPDGQKVIKSKTQNALYSVTNYVINDEAEINRTEIVTNKLINVNYDNKLGHYLPTKK